MKYKSVVDFFPHSPYVGRSYRRSTPKMNKAKWQTLSEDTSVDGIPFAAGSEYKVFETSNFGWVVFSSTARTPSGDIPGRRIFKY